MEFVIISGGNGGFWEARQGMLGRPAKIDGETLLQRTARLIGDCNPGGSITVVAENDPGVPEGSAFYRLQQGSLEIDRLPYELIEDDTCFLFGDVFYTRPSMLKLMAIPTSDVAFFGSKEQILAIKVHDAEAMRAHVDSIKERYAQGEIGSCGEWQLYQSFTDLPFGEAAIAENYFLLSAGTRSISSIEDYQQLRKAHKRKAAARKRRARKKGRRDTIERTKKFLWKVLSFKLVLEGFSIPQALEWTHRVYSDLRWNRSASLRAKLWAYRRGFLPAQVKRLGVSRIEAGGLISERDYRFIMPINGIYNKWLHSFFLRKYLFTPFSDYFVECYYQIGNRDGRRQFILLPDCPQGYGENAQDVLQLIKDKGSVVIKRLSGKSYKKTYHVSYIENTYFMDAREITAQDLEEFISRCKSGILRIFEHLESSSDHILNVQLIIINESGNDPIISDAFVLCKQFKTAVNFGNFEKKDSLRTTQLIRVDAETGRYSYEGIAETVPYYQEIKEQVRRICLFAVTLEFMGIAITIADNSFKITRMTAKPEYKNSYTFSESSTSYLLSKLEKKNASKKGFIKKSKHIRRQIVLRIRRRYTRAFFPPGVYPFVGARWTSLILSDLWINKDATLKEKLWAYKNGFLSYRIKQYGITKENRLNYISDLEYYWLRHINKKVRIVLEDKITPRYILRDYKECFPAYYYYVAPRRGENRIMPMIDCPKGYSGKYSDVLRLVAEKGVLALKPAQGSHGDGFFKFSYENNKYYLNSEEVNEEQVEALFKDVDNKYLITEYIQMHPELKKIYEGAVNTLRIVVFKKDGKTPEIGNAYMRIGSSKTGTVDNMSAGGMYAQIDTDTGRYHKAKSIENNQILPCEYHPDTGVKIEGYLPNWNLTKQLVLDIAQKMPFLEYFGFDVAITENGIKLPEINRFPDYPKIETLSENTIDYLLYKLEQKKLRVHYNKKRSIRLFNLPKRPFTEEEPGTDYLYEQEHENLNELEEYPEGHEYSI
ncbi:MAG: hypothetical protein FWG23_05780 [Eggerthellaceae bacterium]|nr:hypothetical protein [Eggerthellaceae bacterium]